MKLILSIFISFTFLFGYGQQQFLINSKDFAIIYYQDILNNKASIYEIYHRKEPSLKCMMVFDRIINKKYFIAAESFYQGFSTINSCSAKLAYSLGKDYGFNGLTELTNDYYYSAKKFNENYLIELFYWYYTICEVKLNLSVTKGILKKVSTEQELDIYIGQLPTKERLNTCNEIRSVLSIYLEDDNQKVYFDGNKFFILTYRLPFFKNNFYSEDNFRQLNIKVYVKLFVI